MSETDAFFVGAAREKITPDPGMTVDLSGYGAREQPSTGVLDDIYVRTAVIESGGRRVALSSMEILGLDFDQVEYLQRELAANGYRPEDLLFAGTHTHAGPAVQSLRLCGTASEAYVQQLLQKIIKCVRAAGTQMKQCEAFFGRSLCDLGVNRRKPAPGEYVHEPYPEGETDPELAVIRFKADGAPVATIFNYACHAVVMGGQRMVSGDWPGVAMATLEESDGGVTLFLQGCCGDINPRLRGDRPVVDEAAAVAVASLREAVASARPLGGAIDSWRKPIQLPLLPTETEDVLRARLAECRSIPESEWQWDHKRDAAYCADVLANTALAQQQKLAIHVGGIRVGNAHIAWLPAEAFSRYSRAIKASRDPAPCMVAAYSNGNIGYLPTESAYEEGGYEVTDAYHYYAYQMIGPASEGLVLSAFDARAVAA